MARKKKSYGEWIKENYGAAINDYADAVQAMRDANDIAPVAPSPLQEKKEDDSWLKAGAFDDGYQLGDVLLSLGSTIGDAASGIAQGFLGLGEGVLDLATHAASGVTGLFGWEDGSKWLKDAAQYGIVENAFNPIDDLFDDNSFLGSKTEGIEEGLGQVAAIMLSGGLASTSAGATAITTGLTGASSMGSGINEAYAGGATDAEAWGYGAMSGIVNAGTELLFGGLGKTVKAIGVSKGISSLDDMFAKKLSSGISNTVAKNLVQFGVKSAGEGFEEYLAYYGEAVAKKLSYMSEKELSEIANNDEALEAFLIGTITSAMAQSGVVPGMKNGSLIETTKNGEDFVTNLTQNEQKVVDMEVAKRVDEKEKRSGKELSKKEKNAIYDQVVEDLDNGAISIDTIEEVLGGDSYKAYQDAVASDKALIKEYEELGKKKGATLAEQQRFNELHGQMNDIKSDTRYDDLKGKLSQSAFDAVKGDRKGKGSRLISSYVEAKNRGEAFEADVNTIKEEYRETYKRAIDSGVLNNSRGAHTFVELLAKMEADKGVKFDFVNNEKLKGTQFARDDAFVNGYYDAKSKTIGVNVDSAKAWQTTVGHEITHVMEGTELYAEMQKALFDYAEAKGELKSRREALAKLYKAEDVDSELAADLVGDYLFTDKDFIVNLSKNRNLFQKIYDEIKYMWKMATAGSKEKRQLEEIKHLFEQAYKGDVKTDSKADGDVKHSISATEDGIKYVRLDGNIFLKSDGTEMSPREAYNALVGQKITLEDGDVITFVKNLPGIDLYKELFKKLPGYEEGIDVKAISETINKNIVEVVSASEAQTRNEPQRHPHVGIKDFDQREVYLTDGSEVYRLELCIANLTDSTKIAYVKRYIEKAEESIADKIKKAETAGQTRLNQPFDGSNQENVDASEVIVAQTDPNVNNQFSLSSENMKNADADYLAAVNRGDTETARNMVYEAADKALSKSKITDKHFRHFGGGTDELLIVYHATDGKFTVFDKAKIGSGSGYNFGKGFYFSTSRHYTEEYGSNVGEYFLDIRNPFNYDTVNKAYIVDMLEKSGYEYDKDFVDSYDEEDLWDADLIDDFLGEALMGKNPYHEFSQMLQNAGFDGIIVGDGDEIIAFNPNQIKSADPVTYDDNGNVIPLSQRFNVENDDIRYSLSTENTPMPKTKLSIDPTKANLEKDLKTVRAVRSETMLKNGYTIEDAEEVNRFMDNLATFMEKAGVTYKFIGLEDVNNAKLKVTYDKKGNPKKVTMSAMVKNGEYPVNFDFTRICKKRESMSMVIKELAKRKTADGRRTIDTINLNAEALWTINEELRQAGLETACLGCFVESKRYNIQAFADKAVKMWNAIVDEVRQENGAVGAAESFNFAEGINLDKVDYGAIEKIFADYNTVKGRTSPEARMRALIRNGGELYQRHLQPSDLMTPEGIESIKAMSTKKNDFYGILKGVYGQAAPKEVMGFSPYNSEVALLPKKKNGKALSEYVASIGGVRMQSFSDFLVANVYDYMQMVADLSARHLPAHAYTKEIAFAKIFGMTGIKINMSVMFDIDPNLPGEYAGLQFVADENGDEIFNGVKGRWDYLVGDKKRSDAVYEATGDRPYVQSIDFDEAVALQNDPRYSKNCGIIGVGMSDRHIRMMLDDGRIRYIIPYHSSSLPAVIAEVTNIKMARDYTDFQNTRRIVSITDANGKSVDLKSLREQCNSWSEVYSLLQENVAIAGWDVQMESDAKLAGRGDFDIYKDVETTKNPKQSAENYLQYCAENGYMPVFEQFAYHENYYKLLYDFDPYDSVTGEYAPQTEVKNIYSGYNPAEGFTSTETVEKIINDEMKKQNDINKARNEVMPSVVDNVLEQLGVEHNEVGVSAGDMEGDAAVQASLSAEGEAPTQYGDFYTPASDLRFNAPMSEDIAPVANVQETAKDADYSSNVAPEGFAPTTEDEANALAKDSLARITDADAPPEAEAPYYGESADAMPSDPFEDRDIKAVGNRKVEAYMYENPEVKPFFQEEANVMLGELERSTKGERLYTPTPDGHYDKDGSLTYGAESYGVFAGIKRQTSDDIAYLLDECGYSYAEIEKGLKAIIEDDGKENNACSKRIEFLLNDRLLHGYRDFDGYGIPENQDYINLLNEKQITEYNDEARKSFFDVADEYAPPADFAPVAEASPVTEATEDIAPIASEAIRPKRERKQSNEPRMKRVDSRDSAPREKQRKWAGTSTKSDAVDGKIIIDDLDQEAIHYQPISNKKTLGNANAKLDGMGYEASVTYFNSQFVNKSVSLDDVALGERLIQEAIKRGDTKTAGELIQNVAILGTELGQKVQALSIIKRLTPEGQLGMLKKTVERGKAKGDKAYEGVEITQDIIDEILKVYGKDGTYDQNKLNESVEKAKKKVADQMKVSKMDKANAWRYMSMLGNPKTHIRNLVSNVAMKGTVAVKNAVARTIEGIAPIGNRTKTWEKSSEAVKAFADKTAMDMKDILSDGGKYNEDASIKAKRQIFKNKILNGVYEFNSDMLSKEDWWFSKSAFSKSLSEFLTANGIRTEADIKNNPKLVEKAKQYATEQAQIATFRQYSWLANKIGEIERKNAATQIAVGAVLPFKKTPINIAKTALNYSPLGFAKTLTYDMSQVKNGKMEASEMVDHLAQNITGTALTLVGYMLANMGIINGAGEDDKEGEYDYQLGEQAYSINIGDATFSLSWLSPVAMPLFVGANAYEQLVEGKEWNGDVVAETLAQTLDPLSEMSFLSSLDDVLSSYDSGVAKFAGIAESAGQSYITQFVPTMSSQLAAALDDTKRTTRASADSGFKFFDETINNLKYKIPGLRNTLEPTTDIWGNEVKQTENMFARTFESFIAPYSKRDSIATEIDEEIRALYQETGDTGLIPSIPSNYFSYDGEKYEMSAKEYTAFKKAYGQTAYGLMEDLFRTSAYRNASVEEKADMVNKVYDYARDEARRAYLDAHGISFTNATKDGEEYYKENTIVGAIDAGLPVDEYSFSVENPEKYEFLKDNGVSYDEYNASEESREMYNWAYRNPERITVAKAVGGLESYMRYSDELYNIKADKDSSGKSISGSRKEKVIDYINNLDADYGTKIILFKSEYNADDTYNYDIIEYLNSRNDISYKDMETILKELGFTVDSNGNITWD